MRLWGGGWSDLTWCNSPPPSPILGRTWTVQRLRKPTVISGASPHRRGVSRPVLLSPPDPNPLLTQSLSHSVTLSLIRYLHPLASSALGASLQKPTPSWGPEARKPLPLGTHFTNPGAPVRRHRNPVELTFPKTPAPVLVRPSAWPFPRFGPCSARRICRIRHYNCTGGDTAPQQPWHGMAWHACMELGFVAAQGRAAKSDVSGSSSRFPLLQITERRECRVQTRPPRPLPAEQLAGNGTPPRRVAAQVAPPDTPAFAAAGDPEKKVKCVF